MPGRSAALLAALLLGAAGTSVAAAAPKPLRPRLAPTATLLLDGRVLVAGGRSQKEQTALRDVELFDPATGRFVAGPPLPAPRAGHVALRLGDGSVLVAGGGGRAAVRLVPETAAWVPAGTLHAARSGAAGAILADGTAIVCGGETGARSAAAMSCERFEPQTATWTLQALPKLRTPRSAAVTVVLPDGGLYVLGGQKSAEPKTTEQVERLEPGRGAFVPAPPLQRCRRMHGAARTNTGALVVAGGTCDYGEMWGAGIEVLPPGGRAFRAVACGEDEPERSLGATVLPLSDGRAAVLGALSMDRPAFVDPGRGRCVPGAAFPALEDGAWVQLSDGRLLGVGLRAVLLTPPPP